MADDSSTDPTTRTERLLRTRIEELEAEVAELRQAAEAARELVVTTGAEHIACTRRVEDLLSLRVATSPLCAAHSGPCSRQRCRGPAARSG